MNPARAGVTAAEVSVRPARPSELARLAAWNAQLIEDEHHESAAGIDELERRMREWLAGEYRACVFETATPYGYALFRELPDCLHLRHFFVEPGHRRRGLGRRAFECLCRDWFPPNKRILVEVLVSNPGGVAFWRSVGFAERYFGMQYPARTRAPR